MPPPEIAGGAKGGLWNFNATNTDINTSPVSGRFRTNTGTYRNATQIAIHGTTIQGINRVDTLRALLVDDIIQFQDSLVSGAWCRYVLQSLPIDHGTWFQLNVALEADGDVKSGENQEVIVLFTANSNTLALSVYVETTAYLTTSSKMVGGDDTKPKQTDGAQLLTASITPKRASSKLRIQSRIPFSANGAAAVWFALFRDNTADAIHAIVLHCPSKDDGNIAVLDIDVPASTIATTTISLRYGNLSKGNAIIAVNGNSAVRWMGGASRATLSILEHV